MIHILIYRIVFPLIFPFMLCLMAGCRQAESGNVDSSLDDAEEMLAQGHPEGAARICAGLMAEDFDKLDEGQLGRMAVIFMKLPETDDAGLDENVADATQCVRQAWKLSKDSLRGFISTLPPEDVPSFVMLTRISGSIDFPPDLSKEHSTEDSIHFVNTQI